MLMNIHITVAAHESIAFLFSYRADLEDQVIGEGKITNADDAECS